MGLILNIETSTNICSVALAQDGKLLSEEEDHKASHAVLLTSFIEKVLKKVDYTFNDLDAVAISSGPGSFTGLKIGASVAKGICYATNNCRLISVNTLKALASGVLQQNLPAMQASAPYIFPMLDARRMEVYCAVYDGCLEEVEQAHARIIDENSFKAYLLGKKKIIFVGNGVQKCQHLFDKTKHVKFESVICSARNMVLEAEKKYNKDDFESVAYFEPFYLKPANAKVQKNILKKMLNKQ